MTTGNNSKHLRLQRHNMVLAIFHDETTHSKINGIIATLLKQNAPLEAFQSSNTLAALQYTSRPVGTLDEPGLHRPWHPQL